jgi:hypothetical protein
LAHLLVAACSGMTPPAVERRDEQPTTCHDDPECRSLGPSYLRRRGDLTEIRLVGEPEEIGHAHVRLAYPRLGSIEQSLHDEFRSMLPFAGLRWALVDLARWRFRAIDRTMSLERRRELAAYAAGFVPDPFEVGMSTYERFVLLSSLYDIALSFEHSPLVGCTSFVLRDGAAADGHVLLGRNFDFEGPEVLDRAKAVFLMHEPGRIPYASVSWPGFVGSATGMNAAGLGIVIHGARARAARPTGDPVAMTVRDLLGRARTTADAVALAAASDPMVPHLLFVADASGDAAVIERAPGELAHVRRPEGPKVPLTNHFEGPLAGDPANQRVLRATSTLARRQRLDELLGNLSPGASVEQAVQILRDRRGVGSSPLPLGHRSAIDALIATHSVVMDLSDRSLWVSEGPHTLGRYVRFALGQLLDAEFVPARAEPVEAVAADPILGDGQYRAWVEAGRNHQGVE